MKRKMNSLAQWLQKRMAMALVLCVGGCATVQSPEGGALDKQPPKLTRSLPDMKSTNFRGQSITLHFNEFVELKNGQNSLIISPPLASPAQIKNKGKTLQVKWKDSLQANSTYTFNFADAVSDITEANKLSNFQFVFSTGMQLDTLQLHLTVINAQTLQPEKNVNVGVYKETFDSVVAKKLPYYYGKTNDQGECDIYNMHEGKYKLVAYTDENFNLLYDLPNEMIGFADTNISVSSTPSKINLRLFRPLSNTLFVASAKLIEAGKVQVVYSKAIPKPSSVKINGTCAVFNLNSSMDTLIAYQNILNADSIHLVINHSRNDTIKMAAINLQTDSMAFKKYLLKASLTLAPSGAGKNKSLGAAVAPASILYNQSSYIPLYFNHPVKSSDLSKMKLVQDSSKIIVLKASSNTNTAEANYVSQLNIASLCSPLSRGATYELTLQKGAFVGPWGALSDSAILRFSISSETALGNILLKLTPKDSLKNYVVYLTDKSQKTIDIKTWRPKTNLNFDGLQPANYLIKVLVDANKNGRWDTGNYYQRQQAEKFFLYTKEINVKPNWDVELEMQIE